MVRQIKDPNTKLTIARKVLEACDVFGVVNNTICGE